MQGRHEEGEEKRRGGYDEEAGKEADEFYLD